MIRSVRWRLCIVAAVSLTACGTGDAGSDSEVESGPGVDAEAQTITVGWLGDLSGPTAALGEPILAGMKTCWDSINADGGIDGWKVELQVEDSSYDPQQHVQLFNSMKADVAVLASFGSATTKAIQPLVEREGIITVPQTFDSQWGKDPLMAPIGAPYSVDAANAIDYVTEGGTKKPRIGIIYQDDNAGTDFLRGYDAALETYGFDDAGRYPYKAGDTEFTAQVQALKSKGAEVVLFGGGPSASGPTVGTAESLGYHPQWVLLGPSFIENLITEGGTPAGKQTPIAGPLTGALSTMFVAPWGDKNAPGMQPMIADQEKFAPDQPPSIYYTLGYTGCRLQEAILEKAIADDDLRRDGLRKAKLSLGEIDLGGLVPPVTYTETPDLPTRESVITEIDPRSEGFLKIVDAPHDSPAANSLTLD
jgi:ABC-type branched-subunit amino acid transport system substrate-binding protein